MCEKAEHTSYADEKCSDYFQSQLKLGGQSSCDYSLLALVANGIKINFVL